MKKGTTKYIDLHTHTNYSDGLFLTPEQLVVAAQWNGLDIIAKTDHDTLRGYREARKTAERRGIVLLPGVELTTPKYHLLALNFNPENREMTAFIEHSKELQDRRVKMRIEKLQKYGVPITFDEVYSRFPKSRLGKVNLFHTMMENAACRGYLAEKHQGLTFREVWRHYLGRGGVASLEESPGVEIDEAIAKTHGAGGIIGIAHPGKDVEDANELESILARGLDFIEVQSRLREEPQHKLCEQYALERRIPITYGSDYHGVTMGHRHLLGREDNILSGKLRDLLNGGYVKVDAGISHDDFIDHVA